jgi:hypothetical protein
MGLGKCRVRRVRSTGRYGSRGGSGNGRLGHCQPTKFASASPIADEPQSRTQLPHHSSCSGSPAHRLTGSPAVERNAPVAAGSDTAETAGVGGGCGSSSAGFVAMGTLRSSWVGFARSDGPLRGFVSRERYGWDRWDERGCRVHQVLERSRFDAPRAGPVCGRAHSATTPRRHPARHPAHEPAVRAETPQQMIHSDTGKTPETPRPPTG